MGIHPRKMGRLASKRGFIEDFASVLYDIRTLDDSKKHKVTSNLNLEFHTKIRNLSQVLETAESRLEQFDTIKEPLRVLADASDTLASMPFQYHANH